MKTNLKPKMSKLLALTAALAAPSIHAADFVGKITNGLNIFHGSSYIQSEPGAWAQVNFGPMLLGWERGPVDHKRQPVEGELRNCPYLLFHRSDPAAIKAVDKRMKQVGDFASQLQRCEKAQAAFDEMLSVWKSLEKTQAELNIRRVTADGKNWVAEFSYKNSKLAPFLASGRSTLRARAEITGIHCDGKDVTRSPRWDGPLSEVVQSFETFTGYDFLSCDLTVSDDLVISDSIASSGDSLPDHLVKSEHLRLSLLDNGNLILKSNLDQHLLDPYDNYREMMKPTQIKFIPSSRQKPAGKADAIEAVRKFVALIKDHGKLLLQLSMASELSSTERETAVQAALRSKKPEFIAQLKEINDNFGDLSMLEKISITASIRQAYDYVSMMEIRAAKLINAESRLNLDLSVNTKVGNR